MKANYKIIKTIFSQIIKLLSDVEYNNKRKKISVPIFF